MVCSGGMTFYDCVKEDEIVLDFETELQLIGQDICLCILIGIYVFLDKTKVPH